MRQPGAPRNGELRNSELRSGELRKGVLPGGSRRVRGRPSRTHPAAWLAGWLAAAAVGLATVFSGGHGFVLSALAVVVAGAVRRGVRRSAERRADERARAASEDLLAAFADELDAGRPPDQALRAAVTSVLDERGRTGARAGTRPGRGQGRGPTRDRTPGRSRSRQAERTAHAAGAALGQPVALDDVPALIAAGHEPSKVLRACQAPALRQLAVGWEVSHRSGTRLAPVAGKLASTVRVEAGQRRELRAALADARSSARLVASLPLAGMLLGALVGARPDEVLFGTRSGLACLVVGVLLDLAGLGWTNRIAAAAVRSRAEPFSPPPLSPPPPDRPVRQRREQRSWLPWLLALAGATTAAGIVVAAPELAVPTGCAAVAAAAGGLFVALRRAAAADHTHQLLADLPITLDLVAACLAAGTGPDIAQRTVGHVVGGLLGAALVTAARRTSAGAPAHEAFEDLVAASRPAGFAGFTNARAAAATTAVVAVARAFERSGDSGARVAAALERVAERVRANAHVESMESVRRAGVQAVLPLGLCFLPAFALLGVVPVVLAATNDLLGDVGAPP